MSYNQRRNEKRTNPKRVRKTIQKPNRNNRGRNRNISSNHHNDTHPSLSSYPSFVSSHSSTSVPSLSPYPSNVSSHSSHSSSSQDHGSNKYRVKMHFDSVKAERVHAWKSNENGSRSANVSNSWSYTKSDGSKSKRGMAANGAMKTLGQAADCFIYSDLANVKSNEEKAHYEYVEEDGTAGKASASFIYASAGTQHSDVGVKASAQAHVASAEAAVKTHLPGEILAPNASAAAISASAEASASVLGVRAEAEATVAKAQAGLKGTPLNVSASGPTANAGASARFDDLSVGAGAHVAEATAGPFAVRAGVKVGGGVKNGVPYVDLGPVSTPCLVM